MQWQRLLGGLLLTASSLGQVSRVTTLGALRDHARPLLIFAPTLQDPHLQEQLRILQQHAAEERDRDLVPIPIPFEGTPTATMQLSSAEMTAARRRFHVVPEEFQAILLGKDGGEKLRSSYPLSMEMLNSTIDAMPMRKDEMRRR